MTTIFSDFCRETTAFINPTDCVKPLPEFTEIRITISIYCSVKKDMR